MAGGCNECRRPHLRRWRGSAVWPQGLPEALMALERASSWGSGAATRGLRRAEGMRKWQQRSYLYSGCSAMQAVAAQGALLVLVFS